MNRGHLAIVLHAHLPYVFHPASEHRLEERWLFEAITETYIPLLEMLERLRHDHVGFRMTVSLTPTLLTMLANKELQSRYLHHINNLIELAEKEVSRTAATPDVHRLAEMYLNRFQGIKKYYTSQRANLIRAFLSFEDSGQLELITSAATHAFLPLVKTEAAVRAQLATGISEFKRRIGHLPKGVWLPECAYAPEWDEVIKECGVDYFFVDAHGLTSAAPSPVYGTLSPVLTPHGNAVFARDSSVSQSVWSSKEGYPGDFAYREYYRDIGFDLDREYVQPYTHPEGIRVNTGVKYYAVTETGDHKELYNPELASERAARHAEHFIHNVWTKLSQATDRMPQTPIIVAPFDAELFGHWWYEGPIFLEMLFRKLHFDQTEIRSVTPSDHLLAPGDMHVANLPMSTWGRQGYAEVWLGESNDWIYPALHLAEDQMIELADAFQNPSKLERRALKQAARELMLAESSDWAFIMDNRTMVDYAVERIKTHVNRFLTLRKMLLNHAIDEDKLTLMEEFDHIFPRIRFEMYRSNRLATTSPAPGRKRVLFLSWEYPPLTVGGLSRHAYDLSRFLVMEGWEVHVVTSAVPGSPARESMDGVEVHRINVLRPDGGEFIHWVFALNLAMVEYCQDLLFPTVSFDLLHAHDWLVYDAAKALKDEFALPLIATIHATEHGRNNGIHTELQGRIHGIEWKLTYEAWRVIVCSSFMQREVEHIFHLPADKIIMIPNGVDPQKLAFEAITSGRDKYALASEKIVLFIGRMVREKGAHVLLEAIPEMLAKDYDMKFIFTGEGPMRSSLMERANQLGIAHKVYFTGFITDIDRNLLLSNAAVAVFPSLYEPFGIVALEAMAAGTPVVVSDVGGLTDIIRHEHNGLTAFSGDSHSFAMQIGRVLHDPEFARRLADTAHSEVGRFDWRQIALNTIKVYTRVLSEAGRM